MLTSQSKKKNVPTYIRDDAGDVRTRRGTGGGGGGGRTWLCICMCVCMCIGKALIYGFEIESNFANAHT